MTRRDFMTPRGHQITAHVSGPNDAAMPDCDFHDLSTLIAVAKVVEYINTDAPAHFCTDCLERLADYTAGAPLRRRAQS